MIKRLICAKSDDKTLTIELNLLTKQWKISSKQKEPDIFLIPSELCFIKRFISEENNEESINSYIQERFKDLSYKLSLRQDISYLAVLKTSQPQLDIELEPFAIARICALYLKDGLCLSLKETSSVFVRLESGLLESFRTLGAINLKTLDFSSESVRKALLLLIEESGYSLPKKMVIFSQNPPFNLEQFKDLEILYGGKDPDLLGACLGKAFKDPYPRFRQNIFKSSEFKKTALTGAFGILLIAIFNVFSSFVFNVNRLRELQREEFKKIFPSEPAVSPYRQLKAKVSSGEDYLLSSLLVESSASLRKGMVIYSFEFDGNSLSIKGKAPEDVLAGLKPRSTRQVPDGREFELKFP
ncbi:MAG: hypothetical protein NZL90_01705 [Aquificaceae bacterium]|nr:hypothetical protein [Aquificaceae bacterium]MDW8237435.1 hypothetical protein [Aquificaceae bacterium]